MILQLGIITGSVAGGDGWSAPVVILDSCELVRDVDRLDVLLMLLEHLSGALVEDSIGSLVALRVHQVGGGKAKRLSLLGLGAVLDLHKAHRRGTDPEPQSTVRLLRSCKGQKICTLMPFNDESPRGTVCYKITSK